MSGLDRSGVPRQVAFFRVAGHYPKVAGSRLEPVHRASQPQPPSFPPAVGGAVTRLRDLHISTSSRLPTTGLIQVHIGLCAPRMPTIRPYNAEKEHPKRPNLAEEILVLHGSILRHSSGAETIADSIPPCASSA